MKPNTQARLSGVHVFCLNSQELEKERERKDRSHYLKPFNDLSNSMKTKRAYMFSKQLAVNFTDTAVNHFYPDDHPILQEICFIKPFYLGKADNLRTRLSQHFAGKTNIYRPHQHFLVRATGL